MFIKASDVYVLGSSLGMYNAQARIVSDLKSQVFYKYPVHVGSESLFDVRPESIESFATGLTDAELEWLYAYLLSLQGKVTATLDALDDDHVTIRLFIIYYALVGTVFNKAYASF